MKEAFRSPVATHRKEVERPTQLQACNISYGKGRLSQREKLRHQRAEPRATENSGQGNHSQGEGLGSNQGTLLVSGRGNTCLAGVQILMEQRL